MNEHAGPACALSGLIVAVFAVLLHDHSPPPTAPKPTARNAPAPAPVASPPAEGPSKPDAPAAIPRAGSPAVAASPPSRPAAEKARPAVALRDVKAEAPKAQSEPARAKAPARRSKPPIPRPSFAVVEGGETLADVAARIYGSRDEAEALWKANRDQVERIDSPLARGTLLRTP